MRLNNSPGFYQHNGSPVKLSEISPQGPRDPFILAEITHHRTLTKDTQHCGAFGHAMRLVSNTTISVPATIIQWHNTPQLQLQLQLPSFLCKVVGRVRRKVVAAGRWAVLSKSKSQHVHNRRCQPGLTGSSPITTICHHPPRSPDVSGWLLAPDLSDHSSSPISLG